MQLEFRAEKPVGKYNLFLMLNYLPVIIPNCAIFGNISGEFGRAMVRILAIRGRTKIPNGET